MSYSTELINIFSLKTLRGQPSNTKSEMWRKEIEQKKESNQNYIVLFHLV